MKKTVISILALSLAAIACTSDPISPFEEGSQSWPGQGGFPGGGGNQSNSAIQTPSVDIPDFAEPSDNSFSSTPVFSDLIPGAGSFRFSSTGDEESDDDIANTKFARLINIVYSSQGASVSGDDEGYVTVIGNKVTVNNTGSEAILYRLTGTATDGFFKLYSSKKQGILLDCLNLTNPNGAAINNQSGKRTFVMLSGLNTLSDSSSAAYEAEGDEDLKAVFFSEGQLVFSGDGKLTVTADNNQGKAGIASDDYIRLMASPVIKVTAGKSAGHGLRGKDYVQLSNGTLIVSASADMKKGISTDDYFLLEGGTHAVTVSGGVAYDEEDQEYKGSAGIKADNYFAMTGGSLTVKNTADGGKGISTGSYDFDETNHTLSDSYITGGTLMVSTLGAEVNDESAKAVKVGYKEETGSTKLLAGNLNISGGKIVIYAAKCESLEAKGDLVVDGGELYVVSGGDDAINSGKDMIVNGGYVFAFSSGNDAMDSNGNTKLNGGFVYAVCSKGAPEVAVDANSEEGYRLYINEGATLVAYGGLENGYSASQKVYTMNGTAGAWNGLYDGSKCTAAFKTLSGMSSFTVSAPSLSAGYTGISVSGTTYCNGSWAVNGITGGSPVSLSTYSGGGGMGRP